MPFQIRNALVEYIRSKGGTGLYLVYKDATATFHTIILRKTRGHWKFVRYIRKDESVRGHSVHNSLTAVGRAIKKSGFSSVDRDKHIVCALIKEGSTCKNAAGGSFCLGTESSVHLCPHHDWVKLRSIVKKKTEFTAAEKAGLRRSTAKPVAKSAPARKPVAARTPAAPARKPVAATRTLATAVRTPAAPARKPVAATRTLATAVRTPATPAAKASPAVVTLSDPSPKAALATFVQHAPCKGLRVVYRDAAGMDHPIQFVSTSGLPGVHWWFRRVLNMAGRREYRMYATLDSLGKSFKQSGFSRKDLKTAVLCSVVSNDHAFDSTCVGVRYADGRTVLCRNHHWYRMASLLGPAAHALPHYAGVLENNRAHSEQPCDQQLTHKRPRSTWEHWEHFARAVRQQGGNMDTVTKAICDNEPLQTDDDIMSFARLYKRICMEPQPQ